MDSSVLRKRLPASTLLDWKIVWPAIGAAFEPAVTVDSDGNYAFYVPAGDYVVQVCHASFQPADAVAHLIRTDTPAQVNIALTPL